MGFFRKRSQAKIEQALEEGHAKALQRGASEQEARAAGEKAAKRRKRRRAAIIGGAVVGLLTACNGTTGGTAGSPTNSAGASGVPGTDPSLKVPAPLSTQKLIADPCSALGDDDAAKLGLISPGKTDNRQPVSCNWTSTQFPGNGVSVAPMTQNKSGLSDIYAQKTQQAYFQPTTVEGYPAVYADKSDDRPSGTCFIWVGVTDQLAVSVGGVFGSGKHKSAPCDFLGTVATTMVDHLKTAA